MSINTPNGILDITNAIVRVSKLEFQQATGFDTVLNNVARNTVLLSDTTEYSSATTYHNWALKLPNAWAFTADVYLESGTDGSGDHTFKLNFFNNTNTAITNGYTLGLDGTSLTLSYDGTQIDSATLPSTLNTGAWRKLFVLFERDTFAVAVDGEAVYHYVDTSGPRPRVYGDDPGYVVFYHEAGGAAPRKIKNLKFINGDKWFKDPNSSNIAYIGGSVGIGTSAPTATLDVAGNTKSTNVVATSGMYGEILGSNAISASTVSAVTVNSNVVAGNVVTTSNLEVGTANLFVDTTTGNVGIGTNSPTGFELYNTEMNQTFRSDLTNIHRNNKSYIDSRDDTAPSTLTQRYAVSAAGDSGGSAEFSELVIGAAADENSSLPGSSFISFSDNRKLYLGSHPVEDFMSDWNTVTNEAYPRMGSSNTFAPHMTLLPSGNVGIGVTNPVRPLTIESTSYGGLRVKRTTSGGGSAMEFINGNEDIWTVGVGGNGVFGVYKDSIFGEQFFIDTSGNVGIGTVSPEGILHVCGGTGDAKVIIEADTNNAGEGDNPKIVFRQDGGYYTGEVGLQDNHMVFRSKSTTVDKTGFVFYSNVSSDTSTTNVDDVEETQIEVMRIQGDGNVGIGLASPAQKLDVAGRIRADTMEIDSYIYHVGDADTYFGFSGNDHFRIVEGGDTRFQVDSTGYIGIGLTNPSSPLHVSSSTTSTHTMKITHDDTDATSGTYALLIDANYSGSDTFTGNKTNAGLNIDVDSSADGGGTAEEHRIYGIRSDVRHSGDSDLAYGIYSYVRSDHTSGTTTNLRAGDFAAVSASTGGTNSTIYGINSIALKNGFSTGDTTNMYGVRGEVEVDAGTCTNAYAFQSQIDRDGGEITNGYLYYGSYAGTVGTKWGIYLNGETKNYFSGDVGIGTNDPLLKLDVRGDIMFSGNLYQLNRGLGGDIVFDRGGYRIHIFNASGIFTSYGVTTADVLLVAGGGGGGQDNAGGGGAGGLIFRPGMTISNGEKVVVVGNGGMGATIANVLPTNGSNSTFNGLTAIGGGYGGSGDSGEQYPTSGGSGGGGQGEVSSGRTGASGTQTSQSGDSGTYGFGNNGGNAGGASSHSDGGGGGGGGAGAVGSNGGTDTGGNGGDGIYQCAFGGVTYNFADMYGIGIVGDWIPKEEERGANWNDRVYFAGGGAGGNGNGDTTDIAGGHGGGGSHLGTNDAADRIGSKYYWMHAIPNTGGGGSGGTGAGSDQGGMGGSGICIIRYAI